MREIKFRVWSPVHGMTERIKTSEVKDLNLFFQLFEGVCKGSKIMQYTGLKDTNGKEIYEGDIVTQKYDKIGFDEFRHRYYEMIWLDEYAMFNLADCYSGGLSEMHDINEDMKLEVVGNIYENHELLNK